MKQFKTLLLAAALFIGGTSFMQAQTKVAHINTQELISQMPDMKTAQAEMDKLGKTYEADIKAMVTEYQNKMKLYESEANTKTDEENQKRLIEVQTMQQNIQEYQGQAQQDMQKKEMDLLKPITEKAKAAILKVARAQGFAYVLDSTQGGGVIMADGKDLLADVKKELGF
ncbi:OmpH family outer membrane protein [Oceanihabitans sediminis]|uniref:OmpH family outer membrane protein n=1 Tax=Oceanihabitans sediminis TaxID=1812012 RepID=A0A368P7E0_9FLAO|nr:OmpH family outer membrane protein [Oceanihabitans sediminis]MDX1278672.1 OmpH family outer membrane protein [Oceanihabitans sediminis]MDX1772672.1 OmpH family outer membrane protein [Oceanihabitans sediminis]RBP34342.1 periplasmic chaperone for outer membrane proteins Skp [Oceanihabitans sediminis]RCU58024.1 OmpH family outer membrane protein [Oceanihabitans sediminis]